MWCDSLKDVLFNEGVENIRLDAFSGCTSLEELVFPSSVVGLLGVLGRTNINKLYFKSTIPPVLRAGRLGVSTDCQIYVSYDAVEAYMSVNSWTDVQGEIIGYDYENNVVVE